MSDLLSGMNMDTVDVGASPVNPFIGSHPSHQKEGISTYCRHRKSRRDT